MAVTPVLRLAQVQHRCKTSMLLIWRCELLPGHSRHVKLTCWYLLLPGGCWRCCRLLLLGGCAMLLPTAAWGDVRRCLLLMTMVPCHSRRWCCRARRPLLRMRRHSAACRRMGRRCLGNDSSKYCNCMTCQVETRMRSHMNALYCHGTSVTGKDEKDQNQEHQWYHT